MTTTDIVLRINDAIRTGDQLDLDDLAGQIGCLMIERAEQTAWLALIESARESIDGAFR